MRKHINKFIIMLILPAVLLISSCGAPFKPYIGQSFSEWKDSTYFDQDWGWPRMVGAKGNYETWKFGRQFYYFHNGELFQIDEGVRPEERMQIKVR